MAAEENQDLAEVKGDLSKVLRGIAILQTSVDCMAQSLLNPPLDLPVRSEDELDAAEEIIKTATDKRSIRGQLRKVVSEAGDNWLEKLLDPCLLLQYNVNYTKDSKCLMGLEIIALGRSFAKKNSKPDIVSALKRIKDRMKKRNKSQFCKNFRVGERCCEFECLDPPGEDEMYQARLRKRAEILAGGRANPTAQYSTSLLLLLSTACSIVWMMRLRQLMS
ncbi:hypothetical protein DMENIID0001_030340 [Sergentomyia squamirostris]